MFWDVDKIRHIREEKHITREKLATMTGIPIQTLADWEQHRHSPVIFHFQLIAITTMCSCCYITEFFASRTSAHSIFTMVSAGTTVFIVVHSLPLTLQFLYPEDNPGYLFLSVHPGRITEQSVSLLRFPNTPALEI